MDQFWRYFELFMFCFNLGLSPVPFFYNHWHIFSSWCISYRFKIKVKRSIPSNCPDLSKPVFEVIFWKDFFFLIQHHIREKLKICILMPWQIQTTIISFTFTRLHPGTWHQGKRPCISSYFSDLTRFRTGIQTGLLTCPTRQLRITLFIKIIQFNIRRLKYKFRLFIRFIFGIL